MTQPPSTVQLALDVLQKSGEPMTFPQLLDAVREAGGVRTGNPANTLRGAISNCHLIERTGDGRFGYLPSLTSGVTLRHLLVEEDFYLPFLKLEPEIRAAVWPAAFETQSRQDRGPKEFQTEKGTINAPLEFFGSGIWGLRRSAPLKEWIEREEVKPGDSLIFHVLDGIAGRCRLFSEPRSYRDERRITARNQALADIAYQVCNQAGTDALFSEELGRRMLARGAFYDPCPGDPVLGVLGKDPRFKLVERRLVGVVRRLRRWE